MNLLFLSGLRVTSLMDRTAQSTDMQLIKARSMRSPLTHPPLELPLVMLQSSIESTAVGGTDFCLTENCVMSEYLLVCEARCPSLTEGHWSFSLETSDGTPVLSANDCEIGDLNRLTLFAAMRGLEAIEGRSSVTLISNNRYLIRSLSDSLPRWRENNFVWEHFGRRIDVQHADLWRRVDRALQIHRVEACLVSSRLVSPVNDEALNDKASSGDVQRASQRANDPSILRVDRPHPSISVPAANRQPNDRLRQWLLGGGASSGNAPNRRRISTADLLEMS